LKAYHQDQKVHSTKPGTQDLGWPALLGGGSSRERNSLVYQKKC